MNRYFILLVVAGGWLCTWSPPLQCQALDRKAENQGSVQQAQANSVPAFAVASIRPTDPSDHRWRLGFDPNGYSAENVTLLKILQDAYGIYEQDRIAGYPAWVSSQKFTLTARVDSADLPKLAELSLEQRQRMLQKLLADRFDLASHTEPRVRPIYVLVVAKRGSRLKEASSGYIGSGTFKGYRGTVRQWTPGHLIVEGFTMSNFTLLLERQVGRHVDNRTALTGYYDFSLDWDPNEMAVQPDGPRNGPSAASGASNPSIYEALREQLGLELKAAKAAVDVLVIDHVEEPSPN